MDQERLPILVKYGYKASDPTETPTEETLAGRFNSKRSKRVAILIICGLLVAVVTITVVLTLRHKTYMQMTVETECGLIEGRREYLDGHSQ